MREQDRKIRSGLTQTYFAELANAVNETADRNLQFVNSAILFRAADTHRSFKILKNKNGIGRICLDSDRETDVNCFHMENGSNPRLPHSTH